MKAVQFNEYGGPQVLHVVETAEPHAAAGQIRIAVRSAGVNPADWKLRTGQWREFRPISFPAGVGFEAAGVVDEIGEGVTAVELGDAVFGYGIDTVAEHAVLTSWARKPDSLSFAEAGGLPIVVETATRILDQLGVAAGQTLLVDGASGGVGAAVVQFARHRGITVIGTASESKHEYLRTLGAIPTTYGPVLSERVGKLAPQGVDAALDLAGSGTIPELIALAGEPSRVLSIVDPGAEQHGAQVSFAPQAHPERAFAEVARLIAEGAFHLTVGKTYPLEQAGEAQKANETGAFTGKIVITVG